MDEVKRGQIWIADLGENEGSEQRGRRPVLILQNDTGNRHSPTVIVASMTDARKRYMPTHVSVKAVDCSLQKNSVVMLEQIRTIDKCKLIQRVSTVPDRILERVDEKIKISLGLVPVKEAEGCSHTKSPSVVT